MGFECQSRCTAHFITIEFFGRALIFAQANQRWNCYCHRRGRSSLDSCFGWWVYHYVPKKAEAKSLRFGIADLAWSFTSTSISFDFNTQRQRTSVQASHGITIPDFPE
jgi:hypothetical protein